MVESFMAGHSFSGVGLYKISPQPTKSILISSYFSSIDLTAQTPFSSLNTMRYIMLVIDDGLSSAGEDEMAAIGQFNDELKANGNFVMAEGIHSGTQAHVIDNRNNVGLTTPGSHHTDSERYTGFWIIDVDDEHQALEIAQGASLACNRKVELRAYLR